MSKRAFAAVLLFVLGCGGSLLAGMALAGSGFEEGFLDENLRYVDDGSTITFTQTGTEDGYWIVVDGKVAKPLSDPREAVVVRENLRSLQVYKVIPVSFLEIADGFRPCNPVLQDCPLPYKPLPPPPPPIMAGEEGVREEYAFTGAWR